VQGPACDASALLRICPCGVEPIASFGATTELPASNPPELTVTPRSISPWRFRAVPLSEHLLPAIGPGAIALHSRADRAEATAAELFPRL
jgi:hypothetical protein